MLFRICASLWHSCNMPAIIDESRNKVLEYMYLTLKCLDEAYHLDSQLIYSHLHVPIQPYTQALSSCIDCS